jgi:SNF2 family DNA or RNA helicase
MIGNMKQRREALTSSSPVVCTTYDTLHLHSRLAPYGNIAYKRCPDCLRPQDMVPVEPVPEHRCEAHEKELNEIEWLAVAADEAHKIKDPKSKRSRALKAVAWPAPFRWLATGTPMANHEADFWSLLNAVDRAEWPSRTEFIDRYCLQGWSPWGGMKIIGLKSDTAAEFHELVNSRMIRRPREVLMPWLPKALPAQVRYVELPSKLRKTYDVMKAELIAEIEGGLVLAPNPLTNAIRLRQLSCAMLELVGDDAHGKPVYKMTEPSPKLDDLEDIIDEVGPLEPLVVFSASKQLVLLAEERLTKAGVLWSSFHGNKTDHENNGDMARWQAGETQVLLITLAKGAESLTLVRSHIAVYIMESYSSLEMTQSGDRIDRGGQTKEPLRIYIRSNNTIESKVADSIADKGVRFESLVRDAERLKELL